MKECLRVFVQKRSIKFAFVNNKIRIIYISGLIDQMGGGGELSQFVPAASVLEEHVSYGD